MFDDEYIVEEDQAPEIGDYVVDDETPAEIGEGIDKAASALETPSDTTTTPAEETIPPAAVETTPADYGNDEAVPADWQTKAQQHGWNDITTEQAFYEAIRTQDFINQRYQADTTVQQLHALVTPESTPDLELIKYDIAQQLGEWADEGDVQEELAKFQDDEGNLTEKGQKRAAAARGRLIQQFNKTLTDWETQAKTALTAERGFFQTLRNKLSADIRLTNAHRQQAYQYIRGGEFATDSVIDPASSDAGATLERALWSNPATRQTLLKPLLEAAEKDGASKVLQQLLQ